MTSRYIVQRKATDGPGWVDWDWYFDNEEQAVTAKEKYESEIPAWDKETKYRVQSEILTL